MKNKPTKKSLVKTATCNDKLKLVLDYKQPQVVHRLQKQLKISEQEASGLFRDTLQFLFLCGTHGGHLAPTRTIDEGWHAFILHTQDYAEFCDRFFGRFLHHVPGDENVPMSRRLETAAQTFELARETFGELSSNWKYEKKEVANCVVTCQVGCDYGE